MTALRGPDHNPFRECQRVTMPGAPTVPRKRESMTQDSLFDEPSHDISHVDPLQPLAARMRPRTLDEFVGQDHLVGPGRVLRRAIETDQIHSVIFWGPPGTGKTTLAQIIAGATHAHFVGLS